MLIEAPSAPAPVVDLSIEGLAIVRAHGPLEHHEDYWCESYDRLIGLWAEACASPAHTLVLHLDSPGGVVSGAFDTARALRYMADAARKRYVAFAAGQAASAGYALGCTAHEFYASDTAMIGSIGVLDTVVDTTAADEREGLKFTMVASGSRKLDGNPHIELSAEALAAKQRTVNAIAGAFFQLVADCRGLDVQAVAGQQAAQFMGREAVALGQIDGTHGFQTLTALLGDSSMKFGALVEALREAAKGDDANAKAAAKMLSAYEAEDEAPAEEAPAEDEAPAEEASADDAPAASDTAATAPAAASGDAASALAALAAENAELKSREAKRAKAEAKAKAQADEGAERAKLLDSRKDLPAELRSYLAAAPISVVRDVVSKFQAKLDPSHPAHPAAAAQSGVRPTVGGGDSRVTALQSADAIERMNRDMGLTPAVAETRRTAHSLVLGKPRAK